MKATEPVSRAIVGDRHERFQHSRSDLVREVYVRPAIHPDPDPESAVEAFVDSLFGGIKRLRVDVVIGVLCLIALAYVLARPMLVLH